MTIVPLKDIGIIDLTSTIQTNDANLFHLTICYDVLCFDAMLILHPDAIFLTEMLINVYLVWPIPKC
jgi:hypothetical protein